MLHRIAACIASFVLTDNTRIDPLIAQIVNIHRISSSHSYGVCAQLYLMSDYMSKVVSSRTGMGRR